MSSDVVISVRDVSKCYRIYDRPQDRLKQGLFSNRQYYREFWALRNISLDVHKGETVGIIGRNGSGKSTLLQIIAGTLSPTAGDVDVQGRVAALLELGSGFNPDYTGRENIYMNGTILGLSREEIDSYYEEIIDFADIGDFIDQPVKSYSSGMAVRLAFSVQAMVPKEILIVDEALAVGDELFQRKCFAKIDEFKKQGGTILFVSHAGSTIVELCDRAMMLDSGDSLMVGPSKKVVNLYQKLIYAPSDRKEALRDEIRRQAESYAAQEELETAAAGADQSARQPAAELPRAKKEVQEAMFDPHLIPQETVEYEPRGAKISDPEIVTLSGRRVNLLVKGKSYIWRYTVKFEERCENVRFGMLIKTASGLQLGGASTAQAGKGVPIVEAGDAYRVEFTFRPSLNTGTYFLNGGVLGVTAEGEVYLNRGVDLAAFKILPQSDSLATALVDFQVIPEVISVVEAGV